MSARTWIVNEPKVFSRSSPLEGTFNTTIAAHRTLETMPLYLWADHMALTCGHSSEKHPKCADRGAVIPCIEIKVRPTPMVYSTQQKKLIGLEKRCLYSYEQIIWLLTASIIPKFLQNAQIAKSSLHVLKARCDQHQSLASCTVPWPTYALYFPSTSLFEDTFKKVMPSGDWCLTYDMRPFECGYYYVFHRKCADYEAVTPCDESKVRFTSMPNFVCSSVAGVLFY